MLEPLDTSDVERIIKTLVGVAKGLKLGNDLALIRETANRSGFSCEAVQIVIGLIAVFWGRAGWEDLEFNFKNELVVLQDSGESTVVENLALWEPYRAVASLFQNVKTDWLNHFSRTYSTESLEIRNSMSCLGTPDLSRPTITIVPIANGRA